MPLRDTYRRIRPACVAIAVARGTPGQTKFFSFGSGACIHPDGIIVTARHVVEDYYQQLTANDIQTKKQAPTNILVLFTNKGSTRFELVSAEPIGVIVHPTKDVALLQIRPMKGGWPSFKLATDWTLDEGDEVATAGFPLRTWESPNVTPHLFSGVVSQISGEFVKDQFFASDLVVDVSVHPGNSGGPVFNVDTGQLVGIISSQTLRALDLVPALTLSESPDSESSTTQVVERVWTNITHCVPWPSIAETLAMLQLQQAHAQLSPAVYPPSFRPL